MINSETRVTITLTDRRATIEDVQEALDTLRAEGIPDPFEVSINQTENRVGPIDVPYNERPVEYRLEVSAVRAAKNPEAPK